LKASAPPPGVVHQRDLQLHAVRDYNAEAEDADADEKAQERALQAHDWDRFASARQRKLMIVTSKQTDFTLPPGRVLVGRG
jgi:hypothetical protein